MQEQLKHIITRYDHLKEQMMQEEVYSDLQKSREINKQVSDLDDAYVIAKELQQAYDEQKEAQDIINSESDADLLEMAQEQLAQASETIYTLEDQLKIVLLPKDPNDDKNIFLEIRPAAGGDEAGLFASELLKSYLLYAQQQSWKVELIDEQLTDIGGVKNVTLQVSGSKVYSKMKWESGVHRVQRIPATESQ